MVVFSVGYINLERGKPSLWLNLRSAWYI